MDGNILLFIQNHIRNPILTPFMVFFSAIGEMGIVWFIIIALLLLDKRTRKLGIISLISLFVCAGTTEFIVKNIVMRVRPFLAIQELNPVSSVVIPTSFSFPSGHTVSSFSVAFILLHAPWKRLQYIPIVIASLIAVSRLYVGVHYPTDLICGVLFAAFGSLIVWNKKKKKIPSLQLTQCIS